MEFTRFSPELIEFLKELTTNNNREWFAENKSRFEALVQAPMLGFIEAMGPRLRSISPHFVVDARKSGGSLSRIYRDIRFKTDKSPYKDYVDAGFPHESTQRGRGGPNFHIGISTKNAMITAGCWHPDSKTLDAVRKRIAVVPAQWHRVRDNLDFVATYGGLTGDSLKRLPKEFPPDHPCIEDLKRKHYACMRLITHAELMKEDFLAFAESCFRAAAPLVAFCCEALSLPF